MNIWDNSGKLIGSVEKSGNKGDLNTFDKNGQPLGTVRQTGTYGNNSHKISDTRDFGLTFQK